MIDPHSLVESREGSNPLSKLNSILYDVYNLKIFYRT